MTLADVLGRMELLDNELETGAGEDDETRAILALDCAQDYFESIAASYPRILQQHSTLTTTALAETTTFPTDLLRLDDLWLLDSNGEMISQLNQIFEVGGHVRTGPWPFRAMSSAPGAPSEYYANEGTIYWSPKPDAVHTLRYFGLIAKTSLTTRAQTFQYRDQYALPFATFAVRVLSLGIGDDTDGLDALAEELFTPALRQSRRVLRTRASGRVYTQRHTT